MNIERYILGACFYPEATQKIISQVSVSDFKDHTNQKIFSVIEKLAVNGIVPEPVAIFSEEESISPSYLVEVSEECSTVANIDFMLGKFRGKVLKDKYFSLADKIALMMDSGPEEIRCEIEAALLEKQTSTMEHAGKPLKRAFDTMESAYENRGEITGAPTGIKKIDTLLSGLLGSDMILLAARPSIGKTAMALNIVDAACIRHKIPTLFITLEMSSEQLCSRLALSSAGVNVSAARTGMFSESDWPRLTMSAGKVNGSELCIDDCAGATVGEIAAKARAAKMSKNIGLLVIDYLGLIGGSGTEYERVTEASRATKILAKQLNIPILALHQLNRSKLNDRPSMNELRSSGQLEQDADVILLLHRKKEQAIEPCEIIIDKNRHGLTGIIEQTWNGELNRVEEVADANSYR